MKLYLALLLAFSVSCLAFTEKELSSSAVNFDLISSINSDPQATWKAGHNEYFSRKTLRDAVHLCGAKYGKPLPVRKIDIKDPIPAEFDPRVQWPYCESLSEIRDQGPCGSCWAIASAEVMTDRHCVASEGLSKPHLATQDILSCCLFVCGQGCNGGYPTMAYTYWATSGVVTGGEYNSSEGCYPYQLMTCEHHTVGPRPPCPASQPTPKCNPTCINGLEWMKDKRYGDEAYAIGGTVQEIQTELMTRGPVGAAIYVYEDFLDYKSGVYKHIKGQFLGGHAIKILGWGVENGVPYWLCVNSWNEDWGDHGYFKVLRGKNEVGIEHDCCAGTPRL